MALNVFLALLSGFILGGVFVYWYFRRGLTLQEWVYFKEFLVALRAGEYDELPNDERSGENDEN